MRNPRLEIKVAFLGNVSAGKTTVLNAILQKKYGEVAKKRTTAGANYFYLNVVNDAGEDPEDILRVAESIHQEITEDNRNKVRDGQEVSRKEFDIEIPEPIVRCRKDTVVVLIDIPGINEAGTNNKYKEFVSEHWTTFDCVIVVMDGKQRVKTEDQVFLLKFVQEHQTKKKIPVIILCNKIDDPLDEEQNELVKEARKEVQSIFGVYCREKSLTTLLNKYEKEQKEFTLNMSPAFISMSAGKAFIYRCGHQMTLNQFKKFDKAIIEWFGRSQFGQYTWKLLSDEKHIEKVFELVKDRAQYDEAIKECNFDSFMKVLDMFVGGEYRQTRMIERQTKRLLRSITLEPFAVGKITQTIRVAFVNLTLGILKYFVSVEELQTYFWKGFKKFENVCFEKFEASWPVPKVKGLAGLKTELNLYSGLVAELKWESEKPNIISNGKSLVHRYFKLLLVKNSDMDKDVESVDLIDTITPMDWFLILESILLLSCNQRFCEEFGSIKTEISFRLLIASKMTGEMRESLQSCPSCKCSLKKVGYSFGTRFLCESCGLIYVAAIPPYCAIHGHGYTVQSYSPHRFSCCSQTYEVRDFEKLKLSWLKRKYGSDDDFVPHNPDVFKKYVHIQIPPSMDDPNHFGHVPFEFCKLMERLM